MPDSPELRPDDTDDPKTIVRRSGPLPILILLFAGLALLVAVILFIWQILR